nr:MAG TPA: hypothetical protein [Caudoviricetes sp.]DAX79917.1 MAG TPA: hypothetical protein [Caudoviricetes sp.]
MRLANSCRTNLPRAISKKNVSWCENFDMEGGTFFFVNI